MKKLVILGLSLALLSGCTMMKRATGQIDDTVLPGQRQEILPPDQQTARDPGVVGNQGVPGAGAPAAGQPAMPGAHAVASGPTCDPKVDLCPATASPEPLPPPSPLIPEKTKTGTAGKTTAAKNTAKPAEAAETDGTTKTADATVVKKKKKKKPVVPAGASTTAPATDDSTPPVPSAPQPQAQ